MRVLIWILAILFASAIIGLFLMNATENVTLRLWFDDPAYEFHNAPLGAVLFASAFVGFLFTGIVAVLEGIKTRLDNSRLSRKVQRLQRELDAIKTPSLVLPPDEPDEAELPEAPEEPEQDAEQAQPPPRD